LIGHSVPAFVQTPDGLRLIMGTQGGQLEAYSGIAASSTAFTIVSETWGNVDDGYRSHPALADLDNDGILEIISGNQRGGLALYRTTLVDCSVGTQQANKPAFSLRLMPNPAREQVRIQTDLNQAVQWRVFNLLGQEVEQGQSQSGAFSISTASWPAGVYVVEVGQGERRIAAKLSVQH
ncbi:MAG TPA: T9SS type A sorting domain-containing protein, partial [Saprospiraceae bacterium]|nr:T9SS type A sorting domain-containing protein [Saprospiraceae bacterium]